MEQDITICADINVSNASFFTFTSDHKLFPLTPTGIYLLMAFRGLLITVGLIGNVSLLVKVIGRKQSEFRPYDIFVCDMTITNILLLIIAEPTRLVSDYDNNLWPLGETMCKFDAYLKHFAAENTMICQLFITVDRLLRLSQFAYPRWPQFTTRTARNLVIISVGIMTLAFIPVIINTKLIIILYDECPFKRCIPIDPNNPDAMIHVALDMALTLYFPCVTVLVLNCILLAALIAYRRRQRKTLPMTNAKLTRHVDDMKAIRIILLSGVLLVVCWFSYIILVTLAITGEISIQVFHFAAAIRTAYSVILPYLHGPSYKMFSCKKYTDQR